MSPLPASRRRAWIGLAILAIVALLVIGGAPFIGYATIDFAKVLDSLRNGTESADKSIFIDLRLARTVFAALVGGALAVAGAVFQVALRNDLATPYTLGVSGGASVGALIALHAGMLGYMAVFGGLAGGLVAVSAILLIARMVRSREGTVTLLLAGVTLNMLFGAMVLVLQYLSDPYQTFMMLRWLMGAVDVADFSASALLAPCIAVGLVILMAHGQGLNLLALDDQTSRSLGLDADRARLVTLGVSATLTALVVSFAGPIGFIGLVVPHAVRRLVGADNRFVLPGSMLAGAAFLVLADVVGRKAGGATEVPVGVVMTLIGAPAFLAVLLRQEWRRGEG